MDGYEALRLAVDLVKVPSRVRAARAATLPPGIPLLLEIAAREAPAEEIASAATGLDGELLRRASAFFIEQILLAPDADSYKVLGCVPRATTAELRRNMALLLRWLHPDMASGSDHAVFAARVTAAWDDLKTAERRAAYDDAVAAIAPDPEHRAPRAGRSLRHRRVARHMHLLSAPSRKDPISPWQWLLVRLMNRR